MSSPNACPCGSEKPLNDCCGPLLSGEALPKTAEELMRSRYTAFTQGLVGYIRDTRHPRSPNKFSERSVRKWSRESTWHGLEVRETSKGQEADETGTVEFVAHYTMDGQRLKHEETASFHRHDGRWCFLDGEYVAPEPMVRAEAKVGRNEKCPCGSGKKYKRCCANR